MKSLSLQQRFAVWFLVVSLLPIAVSGFLIFRFYRTELRETVLRQIEHIADKKIDQIEAYLRSRQNEARTFSRSPAVSEAVRDLTRAFERDGPDSAPYRALDARWRPHFTDYLERSEYHDLFLISPQGAIVYSHTREPDFFGTNLLTGPHRDTGFARAVRDALGTLEGTLSELELHAPSPGIIAAFIAIPLVSEERLDGILALQLRSDPIFQVVADNIGLGQTGETLVARRLDEHTALALAPLKFDPAAALKRRIPLHGQSGELAIAKALRGERGSGLARDWRDRKVAAAWRHLPALNCGFVVKIDAVEAFAPVARLRFLSFGILCLSILTALGAALVLGRSIVDPIEALTQGAHRLARGDWRQRVPVQGGDELGQLAVSFNTMAEQLTLGRGQLETSLQITRKQFEDFFEHSGDAIIMAEASGRITHANAAAEALFGYTRAELVGQSVDLLLPQPVQARPGAQSESDRRDSDPRVTGSGRTDLRGRRKDGTEFSVEITLSPLQTTEGAKVATTIRDVTLRHQAEAAVRESEARLQRVMDGSDQGYWEWDVAAGKVERSARWFTMLGYEPGELAGTYAVWTELIHPDDRPATLAILAEHVEGRSERYETEYRLRTKTGAWKWIFTRGQLTRRDATGRANFISGTHIDIDDRKRAELALREREQLLRAISDNLPHGGIYQDLTATDGAQRFVYLSAGIERLFGVPVAEALADSATLRDLIHPEDREIFAHAEAASARQLTPFDHAARIVPRTGGVKWLRFRSQPQRLENGDILWHGLVADITRQKESEAALHALNARLDFLLSSSPATIFTCEPVPPYGATFISANITAVLGYAPEDFLTSPGFWADRVHPEDRDRIFAGLAGLFTRGSHTHQYRFRHRDGTWRWMESTLRVVRRPDGRVAEVIGYFIDVTSQKEAEEALRKNSAQLTLALDASQTSLWDSDVKADRIFVDERWSAMLGSAPASGETTLRQLGRLVHPDDRARVLHHQFEVIRGTKADYDIEHRVRHRQGHWMWIRSRGQVVARDAAGTPLRMIGTNTDITQRKLQEERLQRTIGIAQEQTAALTGTIAVLEKTKRSFRSTELAELRRRLEALLATIGKP